MARKRLPDEEELSPLSIPVSLRKQIEQSARRNRRSLNQEMILWPERAAQDFGTPEVGRLLQLHSNLIPPRTKSSLMAHRELQPSARLFAHAGHRRAYPDRPDGS